MALSGIDVSGHQGDINWQAVPSGGHVFAFCKATEGTSFTDPRFAANWAGALSAGLVRGAYHFLRSTSDGAAQARHFLNVIGDVAGSMAALDVESTTGSQPRIEHARAFVDEYRRLTGGHPIVIYTGRWYWRDTIGDPHGADLGPLWHSAYASTPGPVYGGWDQFTFWQYTNTGRCPGIAGDVDLNLFFGELSDLHALTGADEEDDMADYVLQASDRPAAHLVNGRLVKLRDGQSHAEAVKAVGPNRVLDITPTDYDAYERAFGGD